MIFFVAILIQHNIKNFHKQIIADLQYMECCFILNFIVNFITIVGNLCEHQCNIHTYNVSGSLSIMIVNYKIKFHRISPIVITYILISSLLLTTKLVLREQVNAIFKQFVVWFLDNIGCDPSMGEIDLDSEDQALMEIMSIDISHLMHIFKQLFQNTLLK